MCLDDEYAHRMKQKTFRDEAALALFVQLLAQDPADRLLAPAVARLAYERADALIAAR